MGNSASVQEPRWDPVSPKTVAFRTYSPHAWTSGKTSNRSRSRSISGHSANLSSVSSRSTPTPVTPQQRSRTASMSEKFVSYESTMIHLNGKLDASLTKSPGAGGRPGSPSLSSIWSLKIIPKHNEMSVSPSTITAPSGSVSRKRRSSMSSVRSARSATSSTAANVPIIFGICDSALLEQGYKHKYYGFGYSVTYCGSFKFQSFVARFKTTDEIIIKYDKSSGRVSFWCNGVRNDRIIRVDSRADNVITVKPYDQNYDVLIG